MFSSRTERKVVLGAPCGAENTRGSSPFPIVLLPSRVLDEYQPRVGKVPVEGKALPEPFLPQKFVHGAGRILYRQL